MMEESKQKDGDGQTNNIISNNKKTNSNIRSEGENSNIIISSSSTSTELLAAPINDDDNTFNDGIGRRISDEGTASNHNPPLASNEPYIVEPERPSADEMDLKRREQMAYEYLCRLDEVRGWIGECLDGIELPPPVQLEEQLTSGVHLALLAHFFAPDITPLNRIFDKDFERFQSSGLHFRHTDNTMQWIRAMRYVKLPEIFIPDTTDVYDNKNMPKAVFCLHALALYLYRKGLAPPMRKADDPTFTKEEVSLMAEILRERGIKLPAFSKVDGLLADELSKDQAEMHLAIVAINEAVDSGDMEETTNLLRTPSANIHLIRPSRSALYLSALQQAKNYKSSNSPEDSEDIYDKLLRRDEIQSQVDSVNVNDALEFITTVLSEDKGPDELYRGIRDPVLNLPRAFQQITRIYYQRFRLEDLPVTHEKAQMAMTECNTVLDINKCLEEESPPLVTHLNKLKSAAGEDSQQGLLSTVVNPELSDVYQQSLLEANQAKAQEDPECPVLNAVEIWTVISAVNDQSNSQNQLERLVTSILNEGQTGANDGAGTDGAFADWESLQLDKYDPQLTQLYALMLKRMVQEGKDRKSITREDLDALVARAKEDFERAVQGLNGLGLINDSLSSTPSSSMIDPTQIYGHLTDHAEFIDVAPSPGIDLQKCHLYAALLRKTKEHKSGSDAWLEFSSTETGAVYYAKKNDLTEWTIEPPASHENSTNLNFEEISNCIRDSNTAAEFYADKDKEVVRSQAQIRMFLARRRFQNRLKYLKQQEESAIKIQKYVKRKQVAKDYKELLSTKEPSLALVRKFVDASKKSDADYQEELELDKLRQKVTNQARSCQQMEEDLSEMDTKIGLLVQNRIQLQEVIRQGQKLKSHEENGENGGDSNNKENSEAASNNGGSVIFRQSIARRAHTKLAMYQQLLYYLQTQPHHLSKMLLNEGWSGRQRLVNQFIMPLFSQMGQRREEYLLLSMLRTFIAQEAAIKLKSIQDFANLQSPNIALSLTRQKGGNGVIAVLSPLIKELTAEKPSHINTDPVEIYEYVIGKPADDANASRCAEVPEVNEVLTKSLEYLDKWTKRLFTPLLESANILPYSVRYICRVLYRNSEVRLSGADASQSSLLKAVGSTLHRSYFEPLLRDPIAHALLPSNASPMTDDQQKILSSITKLIHYSVDNKGFGDDNPHLIPLNDTIRSLNHSFKSYTLSVIDVLEPEEEFGMDEFSDMTTSASPSVYISLENVSFLHKSCVENKCHDEDLGKVLKDLGKPESLKELANSLGESGEDGSKHVKLELRTGKPTLSFVQSQEAEDRHKFVLVKKLVTEVIMCQGATNIGQLLVTPASKENEMLNQKLNASQEKTPSLEDKKNAIRTYLSDLEKRGLVSSSDNYQAILSSIAKVASRDVISTSSDRERRKTELERYNRTLEDIQQKQKYQNDQVAKYKEYMNDCLNNMVPESRNSKRASMDVDTSSKPEIKQIKYSGDKMAKKGVLLEIKDIPHNKWKNYQLQLIRSDKPGTFEVDCKLNGKDQGSRYLQLQELLKLQYEGVEVVTLFNILVFSLPKFILLLNKKFYC